MELNDGFKFANITSSKVYLHLKNEVESKLFKDESISKRIN